MSILLEKKGSSLYHFHFCRLYQLRVGNEGRGGGGQSSKTKTKQERERGRERETEYGSVIGSGVKTNLVTF